MTARREPASIAPAAVFAALGDPSRLAVFEAVASAGPTTATQVAEGLPISRQAVAKHLGVLRDAGLVVAERAGRETRFRADGTGLTSAATWITDVGAAWDRRLASLGRHLEQRERGKNQPR